jgi:UDP-N-acetylmuramoyl-tripeptide--D-alanyl-D-alanine ligase
MAIVGEVADGHCHLQSAVLAGAAAVCVQRDLTNEEQALLRDSQRGCLRVKDTLAAFQELARWHRRRFPDLRVVAVTGSSGKTSTKEMIAAILEERYPGAVLKTEGNTNNHFGVPRNLLRLQSHHRAAVLELGSNHSGEIAALTRLVEPEVGVVCNVGRAHLENFGDELGVAREKGALLAGLEATGTAVLPVEGPGCEVLLRLAGTRRKLSFGFSPEADLHADYHGASGEDYALTLTWRAEACSCEFRWALGGRHQALNAAAAAAAATALGIEPELVVAGLGQCRLPGMRMQVSQGAGINWVNDAYNSNPDSARAGLESFREMTASVSGKCLVLVLGDMLELGPTALAEHRSLLEAARRLFPHATIFGVGPLMTQAAGADVLAFATADEAREHLFTCLAPGCWVFLKGSRGIHLERCRSGR